MSLERERSIAASMNGEIPLNKTQIRRRRAKEAAKQLPSLVLDCAMNCFINDQPCESTEICDLTGCEIDAAACRDSPDGKHHSGPIGADEPLMGLGQECYYCGEIS